MLTKGADTRQRILETAFHMAAEAGLTGVSLADLASELGISKSGLFSHFKSKEELQMEMLRTASAQFVEVVMEPAFRKPRGLPRIRALFENWMCWAIDISRRGGCIFVAAAVELDDAEGPVRAYVVDQQRALTDALVRGARYAVEEGHFRKNADPEQFAFELDGIYHMFHHAHRLMRDPEAARRARNAFDRLIQSYAAPARA